MRNKDTKNMCAGICCDMPMAEDTCQPCRQSAKQILRDLADEYRLKANQVESLAASLTDNIPPDADDILWKLAVDAMDKLHRSL